jgi:hypothetical protein
MYAFSRPAPKPTPPPPAPAPVVSQPPPGIPSQEPVAPAPAAVEEPTTAEAPAWETEPETSAEAPPDLQMDGWTVVSTPASPDEHNTAAQPEIVTSAAPEPEPVQTQQPYAVSPMPAQVQHQSQPEVPKTLTPTPGSRQGVSVNRSHPRYKTDQAVVLPSSFGTPLEKVGMQFGSLSLGGEGTEDIVEGNSWVASVVCRCVYSHMSHCAASLLLLAQRQAPTRLRRQHLRRITRRPR